LERKQQGIKDPNFITTNSTIKIYLSILSNTYSIVEMPNSRSSIPFLVGPLLSFGEENER